jgi:hypothetical protein
MRCCKGDARYLLTLERLLVTNGEDWQEGYCGGGCGVYIVDPRQLVALWNFRRRQILIWLNAVQASIHC